MPTIQLLGRIFPAIAMVSAQIPDVQWIWGEKNLELRFRVRIANSVVNIECELEKYEPEFFAEIYKRASDLARASVNVVSFASGIGLTVILETLILPDGVPSAILLNDPAVVPLCTAYSLDPARQTDLNAIASLAFTEPQLFRALNDLVETLTLPHVAPVNCGRVLDALRRMITPDESVSAAQAWETMHQALNVSREFQELISEQSKGPRHGDPAFIPGNVTVELTHRTWALMNRYLEYRKRGAMPLSGPEFPRL